MKAAIFSAITLFVAYTAAQGHQGPPGESAKPADTTPHSVQFVPVDKNVKLEVLDWGGTGRPLVLLAGMGFDAHAYDAFAPKLISSFHVYGITRRGFGASTAPKPDCQNYSADRLADDVLSVISALKINHPVLIGHSLAGEELSSIGSRFPDKIAGLVYLDAGYSYAYYDPNSPSTDPIMDSAELKREMDQMFSLAAPRQRKEEVRHMLEVSIPRFEKDLREVQKQLEPIPDSVPAPPDSQMAQVVGAIQKSVQVYGGIKCPVLAIFAIPPKSEPRPGMDASAQAAAAEESARVSAQADAFQKGNPQAKVVRLPHADHFVFRSNEADVLREINSFAVKL